MSVIWAALTAFFGWWIRQSLQTEFSKELQSHKREIDKELQAHKAELDRDLQRHRVALESGSRDRDRLIARKLEVVEDVYDALATISTAALRKKISREQLDDASVRIRRAHLHLGAQLAERAYGLWAMCDSVLVYGYPDGGTADYEVWYEFYNDVRRDHLVVLRELRVAVGIIEGEPTSAASEA